MARRFDTLCRAALAAALLVAAAIARAGENTGASLPASSSRSSSGVTSPPIADAAGARDDDLPLEPEATEKTRWYGWQTLAADVAVMGAFAASVGFRSAPAALVGSVGYYAGGPLVRGLHRDGMGWSLLRRLTFPIAGGLLGFGVGRLAGHDSGDGELCSGDCAALAGGLIGVSAGMLGAMSYDWITARETAPAEAREVAWTTVVMVTPRTRAVGLLLRF